MQYDWLIENVNLVTFAKSSDGYGLQKNTCIALTEGKVTNINVKTQKKLTAKQRLDANGRYLTPGLIDCHTHLVFGGNRAEEFEWRLQGTSYQEIAQRGGGIVSSVRDTRALSEQELFDQSAPRLQRLLEEGVTTVEIKSGYGLDIESEIKMLRVARALESAYPVTIKTTFLGAHAVPLEFQNQADSKQAYINFVCQQMLPEVVEQQLADAVDVFCEGIGFSTAQCEQVYKSANKLGLPIKAHVEQLSDLKGAVKAATYDALSVDHIEYLDPADVAKLKNTVAVLLPAAFYYLNETQKPPTEALRKHNIPMAVATDLNPGTAPMASLLTAINQACILFGLTPYEALKGATAYAAQALDISNKGRIENGMDADLLLWDINHPAELAYGINFHRPNYIWQNGQLVGGSEYKNAD